MTHRHFVRNADSSTRSGFRGKLRRFTSMVAAVGVVASGIVATQFAVAPQSAQADEFTGCSYGVGGPHAGTICWLNFDAITTWNNEPVVINLEGGYKVSFTVNRTTNSSVLTGAKAPQARSAPTWSGSVFGKAVYVGVKGKPALYSGEGALSTYRLSNIQVLDHNNVPVTGWSVVSMNGEAQAANESITWRSDVTVNELARLKNPNNGCLDEGAPPLSGTSVACAGGKAYDPIVSAVQPTWFEAAIQGGGGGDVVLGFEFAKIELKDQFVNRISDLDSVDLSMTAPNGTHMGSKTVTAAAQQGTTGSQTVLPVGEFVLSEQLTSGTTMDRDNYDQAWSCVNKVTAPQAPFTVTEVPIAVSVVDHRVSVNPQAGDDIVCTVTNTGKVRGLTVAGNAQGSDYRDVNGNELKDQGDTQVFQFTVENSGDLALHGITVNDTYGPVTCPVDTLAPGASTVCTSNAYTFTGADVTAGKATDQATASGFPPSTIATDLSAKVTSAPSHPTEVPLQQATPSVELTYGATPATVAKAGETVTYSYTVKNSGNVKISGVEIYNSLNGVTSADCGDTTQLVAPGNSVACTATYVVTQDDIDNGLISNVASAQAQAVGAGTVSSANIPSSVTADPQSGLSLSIAAAADAATKAGDTVVYTYTLKNSGDATLVLAEIVDMKTTGTGTLSTPQCDTTALALKPGAEATCTATYTVSQEDVDSGAAIGHDAKASALAPKNMAVASDAAHVDFTVNAAKGLSVSQVVDKGTASKAGDTVTYTFVAQNTGAVSLDSVQVVKDALSGQGTLEENTCTANLGKLAPAHSVTCSVKYRLTQEDIDAAEVVRTIQVGGVDPSGKPVTSQDNSVSFTVAATPGLAIDKFSVKPEDVINNAGEAVEYTFEMTNTGNVSLTDPDVVTKSTMATGPAPEVTCDPSQFGPGETTVCVASYTVTQSDMDLGTENDTPDGDNKVTIKSITFATATPVRGAAIASEDFETGFTVQHTYDLDAEALPVENIHKAGQKMAFEFDVTNKGNVSLYRLAMAGGIFTGHGPQPQITCDAETVVPNQVVRCRAEYTATQEDVDSGAIQFVPVALASNDTGDYAVTARPTNRVAEVIPAPKLTLKQSVKVNGPMRAGAKATYTFVVTNDGNLTISGVQLVKESFSGKGQLSDIVCGDGAKKLAPGEQVTCTADYTLTDEDIAAGRIDHVVSARGDLPEYWKNIGAAESETTVEAAQTETSLPLTSEKAAAESKNIAKPAKAALSNTGAAVAGGAGIAAMFILLGGGMIVARKRAER